MTTRRLARSTALVLFVLCSGCKSRKELPGGETGSSAKARASAVSFEPAAAPVASAGPAPAGLIRVAREQAVVELLRGQVSSDRLPEIATDDGGVVDPALRDALAPRKVTAIPAPLVRPKPTPSGVTSAPVGLGDF